jgi:hypothetical protein
MGPRIYPSQQSTNLTAKGSLLVTFEEYEDTSNDYIEIIVNSLLIKKLYFSYDGIFTYLLNIGDVVTITVYNASPSSGYEMSISRYDYTTDEADGDNGVKTTNIIYRQVISTYTFTVSTISNAYSFVYVFDNMDGRRNKIKTESNKYIMTENNVYINQQY